MDPLSIVTSAVTIASAITTSLRLLQQMHDAPKYVTVLLQELSDFEIILAEVDKFLSDSPPTDISQSTILSQYINTALLTLTEIDFLIKTKFLRRGSDGSEPAVRRLACLKSTSRLKELQNTLQSVKMNLTTMLGVTIA